MSRGLVATAQLVTVFTLSHASGLADPDRPDRRSRSAHSFNPLNRRLRCCQRHRRVRDRLLDADGGTHSACVDCRSLRSQRQSCSRERSSPLEKRGTALSIITGGTSIAVALGVPISALIGHGFGWRLTFVVVGTISVLATFGLLFGLGKEVSAELPVATLRARAAVGTHKPVLLSLLVTLLWATGAYTVYTYLAAFLARHTGIDGAHAGLVLFIWGASAAIGVTAGGRLNDRFGSNNVILSALALLGASFVTLSLSAYLLSPAVARIPVLIATVVWGLAAWSYFPAQQARLIDVAGVKLASVVLSLNASFMYGGFALGALLGSATIAQASSAALGFVGVASVAAALLLASIIMRDSKAADTAHAELQPVTTKQI